MVQKVNVNFKLDTERKSIIESLISTGTYKSISEFCRLAVDEHLAKYTDIPTLLSLDRKLKLYKSLIDGLSESDRIQNRQIAEIQKELEANRS